MSGRVAVAGSRLFGGGQPTPGLVDAGAKLAGGRASSPVGRAAFKAVEALEAPGGFDSYLFRHRAFPSRRTSMHKLDRKAGDRAPRPPANPHRHAVGDGARTCRAQPRRRGHRRGAAAHAEGQGAPARPAPFGGRRGAGGDQGVRSLACGEGVLPVPRADGCAIRAGARRPLERGRAAGPRVADPREPHEVGARASRAPVRGRPPRRATSYRRGLPTCRTTVSVDWSIMFTIVVATSTMVRCNTMSSVADARVVREGHLFGDLQGRRPAAS